MCFFVVGFRYATWCVVVVFKCAMWGGVVVVFMCVMWVFNCAIWGVVVCLCYHVVSCVGS